MTTKIRIYIAITAVVILALLSAHLWSNHRISHLQREVDAAKTLAAEKQKAADASELKAAEYAAKTAYLEKKLAEMQSVAAKQDEQLQKLSVDTSSARRDVERARRVRSNASVTTEELCRKLADLDHPCS